MATLVVLAPKAAVASATTAAKEMLAVAAAEAARLRGTERDTVLIASADGEPVACAAGITIAVDVSIAGIEACDLIWVAPYWGSMYRGAQDNVAAIAWIAHQHGQGAVVAAHGPSPFLLAEAGLLRGRIATVYGNLANAFRRRHPDVDLQPQRAITNAGGVYCAAGMNAGGDLLVTLIADRYGHQIAGSVGRRYLSDSQRSYRLGLVAFDGQKYHGDQDILDIQDWLEHHYDSHEPLTDLARRNGMSARTFNRRFKAATGESPGNYLRRIRVEVAKDLLRETDLTVADIASRVGYRDNSTFYGVFLRHTGARPGEYRDTGGRTITRTAAPQPTPAPLLPMDP